MKQRVTVFLVLLMASLLCVAACRETPEQKETTWLGTPPPDGSTATDTAAADTASATHPASPGGAALVPEVAAGTTVLIVLEDRSIGVPTESIPRGPAVLTIENRGSEVHNLFVEGPGVNRAAGDPISAGQSATLEVPFAPGTYTLYCPILDHRTKGEQVQVTIAP